MEWLVILTFVATASAGTGKWSSMSVKYGPMEAGNDESFFWKVPNTIEEALSGRWQNVSISNDLNAQFVGVSARDYGFNPLYDGNGFLAGAQLCQPLMPIQSTGPPTHSPITAGTNELKIINGIIYFCSTFLIVDPTVLRAGGRTSIDGLGEGLWLRDTADSVTGYRRIPDDADVLLQETKYTWQNCFPAMGKHYFHNFTLDFDCDQFYSWFLLGQDNDVTGLGWQIFGQKTVVHYDWYDDLLRPAAEMIAPVVDECLYDWIDEFTITSVHIYFTKNPWSISCSEGDSVETRAHQTARVNKLEEKRQRK